MYSSLVSKIIESPNYNIRKNDRYNPTGVITKFTPHHTACVATPEAIASWFQTSKVSSANYIIGNDGTIIGCVPEECRAWTSSSAANDFYAITVEVCNSATGDPWPISDAAYRSLVNLYIDVARRHKMYPINFTGDATGTLTAHFYFAATACPGPYLYGKFPQLAAEVNKVLEGEQPMTPAEKAYVESLEKRIASLESTRTTQTNQIKTLTEGEASLKKADTEIKSGYVSADAALSKRLTPVEDRINIKYNKVDDMPDWAQSDIQYLIDKKFLKGSGGVTKLELSWVELRLLCIMSRIAQKVLK